MDYDVFKAHYENFREWYRDDWSDEITGQNSIRPTTLESDRVNSPSHYTSGRLEAIEIIEDAISVAPTPEKGFLQAQILKYLLRLWLKDDPKEDAKKAQWYLNRLVDKMY